MIISTIHFGTSSLSAFFTTALESRVRYKVGFSYNATEFLDGVTTSAAEFVEENPDVCLIFFEGDMREHAPTLHAKVRQLLPKAFILWIDYDDNADYDFLEGDENAALDLFIATGEPWGKLQKALDRIANKL